MQLLTRRRVAHHRAESTMSDVTKVVKARYGQAALRVMNGTGGGCCGPVSQSNACCGSGPLVAGAVDPISANLYDDQQTSGLPAEAVLASLGCGNPTALATLSAGEVVLDLGSGGGIDVLLSARRVGPSGKVYGLDMTDEMLALARDNQRKSGLQNVEFLKGQIEDIPLPADAVDVIISNCVINLSADKDRVLAEAFRVLKPGGRLAVSDVVVRGEIPPAIRRSVELWVGCLSGALDESVYIDALRRAGFVDVSIEPTRVYRAEDAREFLNTQGIDIDTIAPLVDNKFYSGFIRATKPNL
jgi:arsenite methyltransferase